MSDIIIDGNRARTVGNPHSTYLAFKRQLEGRTHLSKEGQFSFDSSQHNISTWLNFFPSANVTYQQSIVEEIFSVKTERPPFNFKRKPMDHQEKAFNKLKNSTAIALFLDPGTGKSKVLTDIAAYKYSKGEIDAVIIIAINRLVIEQWEELQLPRDMPSDIPYQAWVWDKARTKKSLKAYDELKSFDGLQFVTMNIDAIKTKDGYERLVDFIKHHNGRVMLVVDESQTIKNPASQRTKRAVELGGMCNVRGILTGTPISKDLVDLWTQFNYLDAKIIGIKYKSTFAAEYCEQRHNGFGLEIIGPRKDKIGKLYGLIDPYTYRATQEELGLEKFWDEFEFTMSAEQQAHYNALKATFLTQLDNGEFLTAANAISATIRMQQATCGYLPREDGSFQLFQNARMEALDSWLETISDEKIVIWCRFKQDARLIMEKFGDQIVDLSGNADQSLRTQNKNRFINEPDIRFVVGTPDSAGTGTDGLQDVCNRAIFYSNSYNALLRWQAQDRTSRIGGKGTAFYTDLICKKSPDRKILSNLKGKKELSSLTLDDIRLMFNE